MGTILPSQIVGRHMAERKQGVILNISSMNAFRPLTRIPAYSAAKAGVSNFTQWLAVHMAQEYSPQIRVNAIAPGFFLTEQNRFLLTDAETGAADRARQEDPRPHPDGALRQPGGFGRRGAVAAVAGLGFRHRHRRPGGRRFFRLQRRLNVDCDSQGCDRNDLIPKNISATGLLDTDVNL